MSAKAAPTVSPADAQQYPNGLFHGIFKDGVSYKQPRDVPYSEALTRGVPNAPIQFVYNSLLPESLQSHLIKFICFSICSCFSFSMRRAHAKRHEPPHVMGIKNKQSAKYPPR